MASRVPAFAQARLILALVGFWRSDKGLSTFSGLLLVFVFVLPPLAPPSAGGSLVADAAFGVVLVSGVLALSERGGAWRLLMATALMSVAIVLGSHVIFVPEPVIHVAELGAFALLLLVVLGQTFRAGPVTLHRVLGGISAYLLLGVVWAESYTLLEALQPGSFSGALDAGRRSRGWLYFSFVTLTTVGYGDILPVRPAARSLAMLEAVTGPLYMAVLLARLVSLTVAPGAGPHTDARTK
jgi:hypothetical protein